MCAAHCTFDLATCTPPRQKIAGGVFSISFSYAVNFRGRHQLNLLRVHWSAKHGPGIRKANLPTPAKARCGLQLSIGEAHGSHAPWITVASSRYRQNAFASCICRGIRHSASKTEGEPTRMHMHFARDVATLSRFWL
jgi:hypothetical protein